MIVSHPKGPPMFFIIPNHDDYILEDDCQYCETENEAFDEALNWSAELEGIGVDVYQEDANGKQTLMRRFFA